MAKTYSSINKAELKKTLGLAKKSDADAKKFMVAIGLVASENGGFITIAQSAAAKMECEQTFTLN